MRHGPVPGLDLENLTTLEAFVFDIFWTFELVFLNGDAVFQLFLAYVLVSVENVLTSHINH